MLQFRLLVEDSLCVPLQHHLEVLLLDFSPPLLSVACDSPLRIDERVIPVAFGGGSEAVTESPWRDHTDPAPHR